MTSVSFIGTFTQRTPIYLYVSQGTTSSDSLRQTSWSAFLLDYLMYPLIAFCARPPAGTVTNTNSKIDFTVTSLNVGNAWNSTTDTLIAPRTGVYVFSLSFAVERGQKYSVWVQVNNGNVQRVLIADSYHNGYIMAGKTLALSLSAGDTVALIGNGQSYSDNFYTMSFAGFLYEPLNSPKVIWSVHRMQNIIQNAPTPVPFEEVSLNIGNGWNTAINKFIVPYPGVYQLHMTATSASNNGVDYRLMWNGVAYASIFGAFTNRPNGEITRSRSVMIKLSTGDSLYISVTSPTVLYSPTREASFIGFLISD